MRRPRRPQRLSRAESKDLTRRRLLDAARAVFLRHGFHAATVDMVADEAGFTKGAVYSAFASKADLFLALYEERMANRAAQTVTIAAAAGQRVAEETSSAWGEVTGVTARGCSSSEFRTFAARDEPLRKRFAAVHAGYRTGCGALQAANPSRRRRAAGDVPHGARQRVRAREFS
jgi:AcrR family transcriptional regulator